MHCFLRDLLEEIISIICIIETFEQTTIFRLGLPYTNAFADDKGRLELWRLSSMM